MRPFITLIAILAASQLCAQVVDNIPTKPFEQIDNAVLLGRYPDGKQWESISVLRAHGTGRSTNWLLTGESQFVLASRYHTRTTILSNSKFGDTVTLTIQCDILDAATSRVTTKHQLRLAAFDKRDPLFDFALRKGIELLADVSPAIHLVIKTAEELQKLDPELRTTLTFVSNYLGINADQLTSSRELEWLENPDVIAGCSFKVQWTNGLGVSRVEQLPSKNRKAKLTEEQIKRWAMGAEPLAELYVWPSLGKKIGQRWTLDATHAGPIFSGQGDTDSKGKVELNYKGDDKYSGLPVADLNIDSGNITVATTSNNGQTRYSVSGMKGHMFVEKSNGTLIMAHGTGNVNYNQTSKSHLLFQAQLSRDTQCEWRYEAKVIKP